MKFVISTHSGLYFTDETGECRAIALGYYYGIARFADYFVACRRVNRFTKVSPTMLEVYDWDGLRLAAPEMDGYWVTDVHQACGSPWGLYVTDTGHNRICFVPMDKDWQAANLSLDDGTINHKPNSVFVEEEHHRVWVMEHNQSLGKSRIVTFFHANERWEQLHHMDLAHEGAHNVVVRNEHLWYNASQDGMVVRLTIQGTSEARAFAVGKEWHTKGMALVGDTLAVGVSEDNVELVDRFTTRSGLALVDALEMKNAELVPLSRGGYSIGNVNEVKERA